MWYIMGFISLLPGIKACRPQLKVIPETIASGLLGVGNHIRETTCQDEGPFAAGAESALRNGISKGSAKYQDNSAAETVQGLGSLGKAQLSKLRKVTQRLRLPARYSTLHIK